MTKPETKRALREALALARGEEVEGHLALLARLQDPSFLSLLDSEEDYQRAMQFRLRVAQVLEALGKNPAPTARHVLVELTGSEPFLAEEDRVLALVRASAYVRPPPPPLLDLWDRYSQPDDGFTPTTIPVLVSNGHPDALALLERKLVEPVHDDGVKLAWMHTAILTHRNDVPLLVTCGRLLGATLPEPLRAPLVDSLFDYRPGEWYRPTVPHSAPRLEDATPEAWAELEKLGNLALTTIALGEAQKDVVRGRLAEIARLRERQAP